MILNSRDFEGRQKAAHCTAETWLFFPSLRLRAWFRLRLVTLKASAEQWTCGMETWTEGPSVPGWVLQGRRGHVLAAFQARVWGGSPCNPCTPCSHWVPHHYHQVFWAKLKDEDHQVCNIRWCKYRMIQAHASLASLGQEKSGPELEQACAQIWAREALQPWILYRTIYLRPKSGSKSKTLRCTTGSCDMTPLLNDLGD